VCRERYYQPVTIKLTMDIKSLKEIVNSEAPDKEAQIIKLLASDENALPIMLEILQEERQAKEELITDMNLQLSRAHIYIEERVENETESKGSFNKEFITDEIAKFYFKYKSLVTHCFNRFN